MDCRAFEARFEDYLTGELPAGERAACNAHLARCPACRELLELARPPFGTEDGAAADDLVGRVLERTTGPACGRAGELLAARLDGAEAADELERELLDLHLGSCEGCRGLARVVSALAHDLPGLAEVRPDREFVGDVLARTHPVTVRWRRALSRSWSRRWSSWVRRPRFAWEAAFVLTLACLPILTSSAAPFVETAREMTATSPLPRIEGRLDRLATTLDGAGRAFLDLEPVERAGRTVAAARKAAGELRPRAERWLEDLAEDWDRVADSDLGTLRDGGASFLVKAADGDSAPKRPQPTDDRDLTEPIDTRAGDGSKGDTR